MADAGGNKSQRCPFFLKSTVNFPSSWQVCVFHLPFASFSPYKSTASFLSASAVCHVYNFFFSKGHSSMLRGNVKSSCFRFLKSQVNSASTPKLLMTEPQNLQQDMCLVHDKEPCGWRGARARERERGHFLCDVMLLALLWCPSSPPLPPKESLGLCHESEPRLADKHPQSRCIWSFVLSDSDLYENAVFSFVVVN